MLLLLVKIRSAVTIRLSHADPRVGPRRNHLQLDVQYDHNLFIKISDAEVLSNAATAAGHDRDSARIGRKPSRKGSKAAPQRLP